MVSLKNIWIFQSNKVRPFTTLLESSSSIHQLYAIHDRCTTCLKHSILKQKILTNICSTSFIGAKSEIPKAIGHLDAIKSPFDEAIPLAGAVLPRNSSMGSWRVRPIFLENKSPRPVLTTPNQGLFRAILLYQRVLCPSFLPLQLPSVLVVKFS